jgi:hypothetical protein
MPDTSVAEDSDPIENYRDLNDVFSDVEDALGFTVESNSNTGLVTTVIDADSALDLSFAPDQSGAATIVVRATDSEGFFAEDTLVVTVTAVNDAPIVASAMPDTTVAEDSGPIDNYRDLNDVFRDVEDGSAMFFFLSNGNPGLVTAVIDADSTLDITLIPHKSGTASVVVGAFDAGGLFVRDTLVVTVTPVNDAPFVAAAMPDTSVAEDSGPVDNYRDLNEVFGDVEDGGSLKFTVESNSAPTLVTTFVDADSALDLSFAPSQTGNATLVIRATDSGSLFAEDTLIVTIAPDSHHVMFMTNPPGLAIEVDSVVYVAPTQLALEEGSIHSMEVAPRQVRGDTLFLFSSWSDGGPISHQITVPDTEATYTASFDTRFSYATVDSIVDVPADQGGWVSMHFTGSAYDRAAEDSILIEAYDIYRRVDDTVVISTIFKDGEPNFEHEGSAGTSSAMPLMGGSQPFRLGDRYFIVIDEPLSAAPPGVWEIVGNVAAEDQEHYVHPVPTVGDTSDAVPYSVYYISARTATPFVSFDSPPDSGFSVDNTAPDLPRGFNIVRDVTGANQLLWEASTDEDFEHFRIYRSIEQHFTPSPLNLVHVTYAILWLDPIGEGWRYFYKLTAVDKAGNESEAAEPGTVTGIETSLPGRFELYENAPNPFNPTTVIRYDVPAGGGRVAIRIYDIKGSLVRTLFDAVQTPGEKRVTWEGTNDRGNLVASGVYFYRLQAPGFTRTRKMILLK